MTAVRIVDSAKYGLKLVGYLVVVTAVGGGALALGAALAWPEIDTWDGLSQASTTDLAAGGVLAAIGAVVLLTGYVGSAYKLIADAVASGAAAVNGSPAGTAERESESDRSTTEAGSTDVETSASPDAEPGTTGTNAAAADDGAQPTGQADGMPAGTRPAGRTTGEEPTESDRTAAAGEASGEFASGASGTTDGRSRTVGDSDPTDSTGTTSDPDVTPREPTAEEIAFGSGGSEGSGGPEVEAHDITDETGSTGGPSGNEPVDDDPVESEANGSTDAVVDEPVESDGSVRPAASDAPSDPLEDRGGDDS